MNRLRDRATLTRIARVLTVGALLGLGLGLHLYFFRAYPQPIIFGDPRGYYETGQHFLEALGRIRAGESVAAAFESVRGLFFLLGVGSFFAVLEALRPGDVAFFRLVLAGFNALAMLGVFLLGRGLSRRFAGGLVALALAALYPTFALQTGRLYPDPITGCCFVWAAWFYLEAVRSGRRRFMVGAALALTAALIVRSQLAPYMLLVLMLVLLVSWPFWIGQARARRLALTLALAFIPLVLSWQGINWAVGQRDDVIQFGNLTFRPTYPYGFWQFLETDGWPGPYRFKTEPFYQRMLEENQRQRGLFSSGRRQVLFVAGYVARRPVESLLTVLNNAYRLYARPANDYKWDYPFDYDAQVWLHRALCLLALAGLAVFIAEELSALGVFLVPLALLALHAITFTWPRYNVPSMPILIAAAGACLTRLATSRAVARALASRAFRALAGGAALVLLLAWTLADVLPGVARLLSVTGLLAGLGLIFLVVRSASDAARSGRWLLVAWGGLAVIVLAHAVRDRQWHERHLTIGGPTPTVEQEILLSTTALSELRHASEAFVVFDLRVPRGDTHELKLEVGGQPLPGSALIPTMPRLAESTSAGGRDWRGYPQWWALRLEPALLPASAETPLRIRLTAGGRSEVSLGADRFSEQGRVYEGPSFGEWPNMVALKLEYDGDYRRPVRYRLGSAATRTTVVRGDGTRHVLAGVARVRLITLGNDEGAMRWRSAPVPAKTTALGFFAYSGVRDSAELLVDGRPVLRLPLDRPEDFELAVPPYHLCHRSLGERGNNTPYGAFVLTVPPGATGGPLDLEVRFKTGMSERAMFFVVDARRDPADLAPFYERCGIAPSVPRVPGAAEVVDARRNSAPQDTGRWSVASAF